MQLPEKAGVEILDVLPEVEHGSWQIRYAFEESLLLRDQRYFTERTMELVRACGGDHLMVNTLISVATEPDNPFNADHLDERLRTLKMPKRDHHWSILVARQNEEEEGPIETLISWAYVCGFEEIDPERARLAATTLIWFLSTTNRVIRDRATKALVTLLASRISLAKTLLENFRDIDDPYVLERLLASIYGAVMQGMADNQDIEALSEAVYNTIFANGNPPVYALLRDHARGIIEYASYRQCLSATVDVNKARPPYHSPWPIEYVSDELIEAYHEEIKGQSIRDRIVSSTVHDGDFARYVIDHETSKWNPEPRETFPLPSDKDIYEDWFSEFENWATPEMKQAYERLVHAMKAASGHGPYADTPEMSAKKIAEKNFRTLIGEEKWEDFRVRGRIGPSFGQYHRSGAAQFNHAWARRWVCKRAHELGWAPSLHGEFDDSRSISWDRHNHQTERIGKKYQWLALNELKARMADNLAYYAFSYEERETPALYEGEWQGHLRDIDPSLLLEKTHDDGWMQWNEPCWWMPHVPQLKPISPEERLIWRDNTDDRIDGPSLIDVTDPDGKKWLTLHTCPSWRQSRVVDGNHSLERNMWGRVICIVVAKKDEKALLQGLQGRILTAPYILPSLSFHTSSGYLGEYPWHPAFSETTETDWVSDEFSRMPVPVRPTHAEYTCERGGYDHSIGETVNVRLPAPWIVWGMNLHQENGRKVVWSDEANKVCFFDPSVLYPGPRSALIDRARFLRLLEENDLSAVWVIAGEKGVFGGRPWSEGFGGSYLFTSLYQIENGDIVRRSHHADWNYPTKEQLTRVLGKEPPATVRLRAEAEEEQR